MDFENMEVDALIERRTAIAAEIDVDGADLDALEAEVRAINDELERRRAAAAKQAEIRSMVSNGAGTVLKTFHMEEKNMPTVTEIRNSAEYINAYANYVKTGDDKECRALLTENVSGTLPVPELIDNIVRTAWDDDAILSRVRKTNFRGNLKVAFELSADAAVVHTEGTSAPSEESLTLGIVTMIPANIKKWIRLSDEAVAMGGEAFLSYVYRELTHQILHKLSSLVVNDIATANTSNGSTYIGVTKVNAAPAIGTVAKTIGYLTDEASNLVIIMNRLTWSEFKAAQYAGNFNVDPFEGLPVLFHDTLPAYSSANDNAVYMIVGDLNGAQVNYPEGEGIVLKYDDMTEAEADLVKIVGRQYAAHALTAPKRFVNVTKPAAVTT